MVIWLAANGVVGFQTSRGGLGLFWHPPSNLQPIMLLCPNCPCNHLCLSRREFARFAHPIIPYFRGIRYGRVLERVTGIGDTGCAGRTPWPVPKIRCEQPCQLSQLGLSKSRRFDMPLA